ncbi:MAG: sigma-70 family RNA polymerase sigma factor [Capsulimonadaceae bacterium]|nr:sigma-70 family RNA polymerase sigma factor [Capsulimonadaceae bacterium]
MTALYESQDRIGFSIPDATHDGPDATASRAASAAQADDVASIDREWLYSQFAPLVRRLILQYGTCPNLREELVGEIYCRFCALLDAYDPHRGVPLRPYLVRQLSASVYTFVRAYRRSPSRELPFEAGLDEVHRDLRTDPTSEWDHSMALDSVRDIMPKALGQLSERQQNVVLWRYYHDCSFEEIATRLNVQVSTARSLLRHALNGMRRWFIAQQVSVD